MKRLTIFYLLAVGILTVTALYFISELEPVSSKIKRCDEAGGVYSTHIGLCLSKQIVIPLDAPVSQP